MKLQPLPRRTFLFLQGPPGPFFRLLGHALEQQGAIVRRINLNGGDRVDWSDGATDYRGRMSRWPLFLDRYLREEGITDILLFGDCRPMHVAATGMARLRRIAVHVFEEGYIRPDWMTLEPDGVNGRSTLPRDPSWLLTRARTLPPVPDLPPITASFGRRARDSYWYYHRVVTGRWRFPFYRSHRPGSIIAEGLGWLAKFARAKRRARDAVAAEAAVAGTDYFLFPLQLGTDYQIRTHSPFASMRNAIDYVLESFAHHAPVGTKLLVKAHPLDNDFSDNIRFVARRARALGIGDRVIGIDGGDLATLATRSIGMVCVNSTSGTLALAGGTPVIVLGDAVYNVRGITHQGTLDMFWAAPQQPRREIWDAFVRVLHDRCLIRGGIASQSATEILVESSVYRLLRPRAHELQARSL